MSHSTFFSSQLYMQLSTALSCWFLKHHKHWTIAKTCLRYPDVAQSWGAIAAVQGQVLSELLAAAHPPQPQCWLPQGSQGLHLCAFRLQAALHGWPYSVLTCFCRSSKPQQILSWVPAAPGLIRSHLCACSLL